MQTGEVLHDHGFPGYQEVGNDSTLDPGKDAKDIGERIGPDGKLCLHGCNVAGEDEELGNGDERVQEIADDAGVPVEAWPGKTYYVPLPFGYTWYIETGEKETFTPKKPPCDKKGDGKKDGGSEENGGSSNP